ncbi:hypothetical protein OG21DRAFT_1410478 [Imleria badia]|nr:hypothetical protein OG21DRAFT_1410478 [Imleria badia]
MALNVDVLVLILAHLDLDDLLRLASTCRLLNILVHHFGWSIFLRNNARHSLTLRSSRSRWSPFAQVRYNSLADSAWSRASFIARPLSHPWYGNLQPAIALSVSTLLVAAGRVLYSYAVQDTSDASPSRIVFDRSYTFSLARGQVQPYITSIACHAAQDRTVFLGFEDGSVEQVHLPPYQGPHNRQHIDMERVSQSALQHHGRNVVQSISCSSRALLSLSQWGSVLLTNLVSDSPSSTSVNLGTRSWTTHLCMSSSSSYAVFGTTSATPLSLYDIAPHGFSPTPSINLQSPKNRPSAVYAITCAPPSSPLGPSEQIIVSGWYDGSVRIYDLRVSHHHHHHHHLLPIPGSASLSSPPTLLPVLTLQDPWSPEPIYAVSCGGGNASFVTAGTARHSVVAVWDVRQPSQGWSVHAPGNDSSPVYSIVLESSRLFGATQSRPFVYDFGPGVTRDTYPPIPPTGPNAVAGRRRVTEDRLKLERDGIGYHVSKYSHRRTGIKFLD